MLPPVLRPAASTNATGATGRRADLDGPLALVIWRTATGRRIPHVVYSLVGCPAISAATYMLVSRDDDGRRRVLSVGTTHSDSASLNLARIRHEGAKAGADEVHVHVLSVDDAERAQAAFDLADAHVPLRAPVAACSAR